VCWCHTISVQSPLSFPGYTTPLLYTFNHSTSSSIRHAAVKSRPTLELLSGSLRPTSDEVLSVKNSTQKSQSTPSLPDMLGKLRKV